MSAKAFLFFSVVLLASGVAACQPQIGDKCVLNTDCSVSGTRQCDVSMPDGYCTIFNCGPNSCPDQSACYLFHAEVQGFPYDDRVPSRTAHSFCMKDCASNSDCRPGYECADLQTLLGPPWNAILLDDNQDQDICVPIADPGALAAGEVPDANAPPVPVCEANPDIDASFPPEPDGGAEAPDASDTGAPDAGALDSGIDATLDAGVDATVPDAGPDGSDGGAADATAD